MKNYTFFILSILCASNCFAQDLRFSYRVTNPDVANNQSKLIVYVSKASGGTEDIAAFNFGFYYKSSEATVQGYGAGATDTGMSGSELAACVDVSYALSAGWGFPLAASGSIEAVTAPPGLPSGYDRRVNISVYDDDLEGANVGTTPVAFAAVTLDNTVGGAPISTDSAYMDGTDIHSPIKYSGLDGIEHSIVVIGNRLQTLPIELISFKAQKFNERSSFLTWSTSSEINSSHFTIQRSFDKKTWTNVGRVNAAGYSQMIENYEFTDFDVYNGRDNRLTAYYRLQMSDLDGRTKLSPIESVIFGTTSTNGREFVVYPNPTSDGLQVEWDANSVDQPTTLEFFDIHGKLIYTRKVSENTNQEYIDFGQTTIQPGLYLLRILNGAEPLDYKQIIVGNR